MKNKFVVFAICSSLLFSLSVFSQNKIEVNNVDYEKIITLVNKGQNSKTYKVNFESADTEFVNFNEVKNHILGNTAIKSVLINKEEKNLVIEIAKYKPSYFVLELLNDAKINLPVPTKSIAYLKSID
ncbi:MAG: hypothetical protein V4667_13410 [Bacteroidota bacterium]